MKEQCQLFPTLWLECPQFREHANRNGGRAAMFQSLQTHHIFGGTRRINRKSNLIRVCLVTHDWFHMRPTEGKIACLWRQMERGVLNWGQLDECAGRPVRGWLECQTVEGVYLRMQWELLR